MPSKNFSRTLVRTQGQRMGRVISDNFSRKRRTQTGTYLGSNQVRVGGQVYAFRNSTDIDVVPGSQVSVVNAGRRAHAVYEPATGGGTVSVSDGGGGTVGAHGLNSHSDVSLSGLASDDVLVYDGNNWVNSTDVAVLSRANTFTAAQTFPNSGVHILDTGGDHDLILASGEDLSADHTLTMVLSDGDRTVTLSGNPTLNDWFDQSVKQAASPTFAAITLGNTGLQVEDTDASHTLTLKPGSNLLANRTFTLTTGDADRELILSGDLTVPETGTAALLATANVFTEVQTIDQIASNQTGLVLEADAGSGAGSQPGIRFHDNASTMFGVIWGNVGDGSLRFGVDGDTSAVILDDNGNFGVGLDPVQPFEVFHATTDFIAKFASGDDKAGIQLSDNDTDVYLLAKDSFVSLGGSFNFSSTNLNINTSTGHTGLGTASPQGLLHGYDSISGFLHWEFDGLAGTAETVIPNGAGDAVYGAMWMSIVRSSSGIVKTSSGQEVGGTAMSTIPGISREIFNDGGTDIVELSHNADGSIEVQRTAGTDTYKVAIWILFL